MDELEVLKRKATSLQVVDIQLGAELLNAGGEIEIQRAQTQRHRISEWTLVQLLVARH